MNSNKFCLYDVIIASGRQELAALWERKSSHKKLNKLDNIVWWTAQVKWWHLNVEW